MTPQKVNNHTTKNLIDSKGDKISISELKRMIRTIYEMKEDIYKQSNKIKNMNKQLNEFNKNTKKNLN
jgi:hypothetical protein